jgi:hypothetical protein
MPLWLSSFFKMRIDRLTFTVNSGDNGYGREWSCHNENFFGLNRKTKIIWQALGWSPNLQIWERDWSPNLQIWERGGG